MLLLWIYPPPSFQKASFFSSSCFFAKLCCVLLWQRYQGHKLKATMEKLRYLCCHGGGISLSACDKKACLLTCLVEKSQALLVVSFLCSHSFTPELQLTFEWQR